MVEVHFSLRRNCHGGCGSADGRAPFHVWSPDASPHTAISQRPLVLTQTPRILDLNMLENLLRQSILDFEPRILQNTLRVRANLRAVQQMSHNSLMFEIEGELWGQPLPQQLYLKTEIDLESGQVKIEQEARPSRGR